MKNAGAGGLSVTELRYIIMEAHGSYMVAGQNEIVTRAPLRALMDVTVELIAWQEENGASVDGPKLRGIFDLRAIPDDALVASFTPARLRRLSDGDMQPQLERGAAPPDLPTTSARAWRQLRPRC